MRYGAGLLLTALLAAAPVAAFDLQKQTDAAGAVQMNLPLSTRSLGMGGVAAGGTDVLRAWSNPALLAGLENQFEVALVGGPQFINQTFYGIGGGWRVAPEITLGVLAGGYAMSMTEIDLFGNEGAAIGSSVTGFGLTGSWRRDWFSAGLTIKAIRQVVMDTSNVGAGSDLGATGTWGGLSAGVALRNFGAKLARQVDGDAIPNATGSSGSYNVTLPTEVRLGGAYAWAPWHLTVAADVNDTLQAAGTGSGFGAGAEWWPARPIAIRAGVYSLGARTGLSLGLTGLWRDFSLDYAFTDVEAGVGNRVTLGYAWGKAADGGPAEPDAPAPVAKEEPAPVAARPGAIRLNVAIADLRAENVSAGDAAVMADLLRNELVKTTTFNVIEKQNMDKVLAEHAFQQTGCTNEECAVKLGKLLNVQRMAVGSFGKLLDSYFLNIRVVNIETGQVNFADSAEGATVKDLKVAVRDMARRMSSQIK